MKVLVVGLRDAEQEEIRRWVEAADGKIARAPNGIAALRNFEEMEPDAVVLSTLVPDIDSVRLATMLCAAKADLRIVFVGNHPLEASYFESLEHLGNSVFAHRPLDPEHLFGKHPELGTIGDVDLRGELTAARLTRLLAVVLRNGAHGALYVGKGANRRVLYFEGGRPVYATSTILSENFGQMLLAEGRITPIEFDWARHLQVQESIQQGEALVKIGVLRPSELEEALRRQIRMKIHNIFSMTGAEYHMHRHDRPLRQLPAHPYNVVAMIVEGLIASKGVANDDVSGADPIRIAPAPGDPLFEEARTYLGPELTRAFEEGLSIDQLGQRLDGKQQAIALCGALLAGGLLNAPKLAARRPSLAGELLSLQRD